MNKFNFNYYIRTYPDLIKNGINTPRKALLHWNMFGKKEGRKCCPSIVQGATLVDKRCDESLSSVDVSTTQVSLQNKPTPSVIIPEKIVIPRPDHLLADLSHISFCFVISSYNNEKNISKNLYSVINQNYKNWRVIYINDHSTDKTKELYNEIISKNKNIRDKFIYIENDKQCYQMYCKYIAYQLVNDLEIVCILDGDDWLSHNNVLDILKRYYTKTYNKVVTSNYNVFHNNKIKLSPVNKFYTNKEITNIRECDKWLFRHLKTGYGILFKSISDHYLKIDNTWFDMSTDLAEMTCVTEFSNGKVSHINNILYIYNKSNSVLYTNSAFNNTDKLTSKRRYTINQYIRNLPKCSYNIPYTYIINLKKDTIKQVEIIQQMKLINNIHYELIEGIDGYDTSATNLIYTNYLLNRNTQSNFYKNNMIKYNLKKQHITPGSFGLLQSIFKTLTIFIQNDNLNHILILEDDIFTLKNFNYYLFINDKLLENKDLIYLGCHNDINLIYKTYINDKDIFINIKDYKHLIYGGYSIIISKKIAKYIVDFGLENIVKLNLSWDLFLNFIRNTNNDYNFFLYFKELFIPNVIKDGIQIKRNTSFYIQRNINLNNYNHTLGGVSVCMSTDEAINEALDEATDEAIDDTIGAATDDTIGEATDDTIGETTDDTIGAATDDTIGETTDDTIGAATDDTIGETTDDITGAATDGITGAATDDTIGEATDDTIGEATDGITGAATDDTIGETTDDITGTAIDTIGAVIDTTGTATDDTIGMATDGITGAAIDTIGATTCVAIGTTDAAIDTIGATTCVAIGTTDVATGATIDGTTYVATSGAT